MYGYVNKDKALGHFETYIKNVTEEEIRDGIREYNLVKIDPLAGRLLLGSPRFGRQQRLTRQELDGPGPHHLHVSDHFDDSDSSDPDEGPSARRAPVLGQPKKKRLRPNSAFVESEAVDDAEAPMLSGDEPCMDCGDPNCSGQCYDGYVPLEDKDSAEEDSDEI